MHCTSVTGSEREERLILPGLLLWSLLLRGVGRERRAKAAAVLRLAER